MPRYALTGQFFDGARLHQPGDVIEWDGPKSIVMQPLDEPRPKARGRAATSKDEGGGSNAAPLSEGDSSKSAEE